MVHYVGDDGGKQTEEHDSRAGVNHRVQELSRVRRERQHLLQILRDRQTDRKRENQFPAGASDTQMLRYHDNTDS